MGAAAAVLVAAGVGTGILLTGASTPASVGYRLVFRVTTLAGGPATVTTETIEARRPFLASDIVRSGTPPGGAVVSGSIVDGGFFLVSASSGQPTANRLAPDDASPQSTDPRLQPALQAARAAGLVQAAATASVLGIRCTQYLSANPLDGGSWAPPSGGSTVTSCVSADGFLLHENWVLNGKLVRDRVAVSFTRDLPASAFQPFAGITRKAGSTTVGTPEAVGPVGSAPAVLAIPAPPPGLTLVRALRVSEYDASSGIPAPVAVDRRLAYTNGNDVVTLTERSLLSPASPPTAGVPVPLGGLGTGRLLPGPNGLSITVDLSSQIELDIVGTVSESALLDWVRTLRRA